MRIVRSIICLLILLAVISVVGFKNVAAMNRCLDTALEELNQHYTVTALDPGEYKELTFYGVVKFNVEQYKIQGLGNLSVMRVNMGAMQMATFVITPQNKNLPLLSADYMYILSNRKAYLEFYDAVKEIPNVKVYGDFSSKNRCAVVTLNIGDYDSSEVSDALLMDYTISTRPGGHCAPLMHEALGTVEQGAVRFSFSHYNTDEDVDTAIKAIRELSQED